MLSLFNDGMLIMMGANLEKLGAFKNAQGGYLILLLVYKVIVWCVSICVTFRFSANDFITFGRICSIFFVCNLILQIDSLS